MSVDPEGRYELVREIGRGNAGAVWLGRDTVLDRAVAIKQLGLTPDGGAPDLDRAEREAHLSARTNHPHIVEVFDLVDGDGHQWLVMEHVDGPSLQTLVTEDGPLPAKDAAPVLRQVAGALAAAHAHGIVHRDVKPSSILLALDGTARLSDFGVARGRHDVSLTRTGVLTGSPAYLAPEVVTGRSASAASDVWSLGATMFHTLTGRAPYEVDVDPIGAMHRIVHDDPPRLDPTSSLEPVVTAMMQQDPSARPTMADVEQAVTALLAPSQAPALPAPDLPVPEAARGPRRPDRRVLAGAAAAVLAAVTVGALLARGGDDAPVTSGDPAPQTTSSPAPAGRATAAQLEGFAADYLVAASNDPEAGFAMLTPAYQAESGGLAGYEDFWGQVSNVDVIDVEGDPASLTVSYTYAYVVADRERTEDVTLLLERSGDGFLVSGAT